VFPHDSSERAGERESCPGFALDFSCPRGVKCTVQGGFRGQELASSLLHITLGAEAEVRVGGELAEAHVGTANGGTSNDCDQGVDLSGGLHAAHRVTEEFAQHDGRVCV